MWVKKVTWNVEILSFFLYIKFQLNFFFEHRCYFDVRFDFPLSSIMVQFPTELPSEVTKLSADSELIVRRSCTTVTRSPQVRVIVFVVRLHVVPPSSRKNPSTLFCLFFCLVALRYMLLIVLIRTCYFRDDSTITLLLRRNIN